MALTAAEQAELDQLNKELGKPAAQKMSGLSQEEQAELDSLNKELGPQKESSWKDTKLPFNQTAGDVAKGAIDMLPTAGGLIGGIAGTGAGVVTGPGALVVGAGGAALGQAAGESYKQLLNNYLFDEKKKPLEAVEDIGLAGGEGALSQAAGNTIGLLGKGAAKSKLGKYAIDKVGGGLAMAGEALSGIPKKALETYAKYAPEVAQMGKASGGDAQLAADMLRKKWNSAIKFTKDSLGKQLEKGLEDNAGKNIKVGPILNSLDNEISKLHPVYDKGVIAQINEVKSMISGQAKKGILPLKEAHATKKYLQGVADSAYESGGQIFNYAKGTAKAAKGGAAVARKSINEAAGDVAAANNGFANLHNIESVMNRNLLKEGETAASLAGAGSGANAKNISVLKRLGKATGQDMLGDAEKLYASEQFGGGLGLLPVGTTGKTLTRIAVGSGVGGAIDGKEGAAVGAALSSPLAMKALIRSGRGLIKGGELFLNTPAGRQLIGKVPVGLIGGLLRDDKEQQP